MKRAIFTMMAMAAILTVGVTKSALADHHYHQDGCAVPVFQEDFPVDACAPCAPVPQGHWGQPCGGGWHHHQSACGYNNHGCCEARRCGRRVRGCSGRRGCRGARVSRHRCGGRVASGCYSGGCY